MLKNSLVKTVWRSVMWLIFSAPEPLLEYSTFCSCFAVTHVDQLLRLPLCQVRSACPCVHVRVIAKGDVSHNNSMAGTHGKSTREQILEHTNRKSLFFSGSFLRVTIATWNEERLLAVKLNVCVHVCIAVCTAGGLCKHNHVVNNWMSGIAVSSGCLVHLEGVLWYLYAYTGPALLVCWWLTCHRIEGYPILLLRMRPLSAGAKTMSCHLPDHLLIESNTKDSRGSFMIGSVTGWPCHSYAWWQPPAQEPTLQYPTKYSVIYSVCTCTW